MWRRRADRSGRRIQLRRAPFGHRGRGGAGSPPTGLAEDLSLRRSLLGQGLEIASGPRRRFSKSVAFKTGARIGSFGVDAKNRVHLVDHQGMI